MRVARSSPSKEANCCKHLAEVNSKPCCGAGAGKRTLSAAETAKRAQERSIHTEHSSEGRARSFRGHCVHARCTTLTYTYKRSLPQILTQDVGTPTGRQPGVGVSCWNGLARKSHHAGTPKTADTIPAGQILGEGTVRMSMATRTSRNFRYHLQTQDCDLLKKISTRCGWLLGSEAPGLTTRPQGRLLSDSESAARDT